MTGSMTDDASQPLLREETLGDDSPTWTQRTAHRARQHPVVSALAALAVVACAAAGITAWWINRPVEREPGPYDAVTVTVQSTGQGGVVLDRTLITDGGLTATARTVLELKTTLIGPDTVVGRIRGIVGSGIQSSNARGIPQITSGGSSVGLVNSTITCPTALADQQSYRLVIDLSDTSAIRPPGIIEVPLGGVQDEWMTLLRQACSPPLRTSG